MILEKQSEIEILEEGEVQASTSMEIDVESHRFIMKMLSKFYSDGIGSAIRETVSNALDSHRQCGVTDPIIVSIENNNGNYAFIVQDFGCGLDQSDVDNIISKYGKSTKRNSSSQLGCFGLGFKSPLAYSSSFYFTGIKNGKKRSWMMYEADDEENKIDLLYEKETEERNGVTIKIPIKSYDYTNFVCKIKEQLCYFEDVYFNISEIDNNFKIHRDKDFQISSLCNDTNVHICLDNVYYPIDFSKLGISPINAPIGLRFSLSDGIFPTPNREMIKYTTESKKIIIEKIKKVASILTERYNTTITDTNDIVNIFNYFYDGKTTLEIENKLININELQSYSTIKVKEPVLKGLTTLKARKLYQVRDDLFKEYSKVCTFNKNRYQQEKSTYPAKWYNVEDINQCYVLESDFIKTKKDYLRELLNGKYNITFIRKTSSIPLKLKSSATCWYHILGLKNIPKKDWRGAIKDAQFVRDTIISKLNHVDKITIPQNWLNNRKNSKIAKAKITKANNKSLRSEGEIVGKLARYPNRTINNNCVFESINYNLSMLPNKNVKLIVYCTNAEENTEKIQKLFPYFSNLVNFVTFSKKDVKILDECNFHNSISLEKFLEGKHKIYKRARTASLIKKLISDNSRIFTDHENVRKYSSRLADEIVELKHYLEKNTITKIDAYENLIEGGHDLSIYGTYNKVKEKIEKLYFLNSLLKDNSWYSSAITDEDKHKMMIDLFKRYKERMNWENYIKKEEI